MRVGKCKYKDAVSVAKFSLNLGPHLRRGSGFFCMEGWFIFPGTLSPLLECHLINISFFLFCVSSFWQTVPDPANVDRNENSVYVRLIRKCMCVCACLCASVCSSNCTIWRTSACLLLNHKPSGRRSYGRPMYATYPEHNYAQSIDWL